VLIAGDAWSAQIDRAGFREAFAQYENRPAATWNPLLLFDNLRARRFAIDLIDGK
jgi:hypothetical protein